MSTLSIVGLIAARGLKERIGARAALAFLEPLIERAEPSRECAETLISAFECALEVRDRDALERLKTHWSRQESAPRRRLAKLCGDAAAAGQSELGFVLAEAETSRMPDARGLWLHAWAAERRGATRIADRSYPQAIERAEAENAPRVADRIRVEWARLRLERGERAAAFQLVEALHQIPDSTRQQSIVARSRLGGSGRYARVQGLDSLKELANIGPEWRGEAIHAAIEHAERLGASLTDIERERISELALPFLDRERHQRLREQLSASERASESADLLETELASAPPTSLRHRALRAVRGAIDSQSCAEISTLPSRFEGAVDASIWTALLLALRDSGARPAALERLGNLLEGEHGPPPRGFLDLAARLRALRETELAHRALVQAVEHHERDARTALQQTLTHSAWVALETGDRDRARRLLREARAVRSPMSRSIESTANSHVQDSFDSSG